MTLSCSSLAKCLGTFDEEEVYGLQVAIVEQLRLKNNNFEHKDIHTCTVYDITQCAEFFTQSTTPDAAQEASQNDPTTSKGNLSATVDLEYV